MSEPKFRIGDEVEVIKADFTLPFDNIGKTTFVTRIGRNSNSGDFIKTEDLESIYQNWISAGNFKLLHRKGQGYYKTGENQ